MSLLHEDILEIATKNYTDRKATSILHAIVNTQDLEIMDFCTETVLAFVFGMRNVRLVVARLLLEAGANVNVTNVVGTPLLSMSCNVKHTKLLLEGMNNISTGLGRIQLPFIRSFRHYIFVQLTFIHDVLIEAV